MVEKIIRRKELPNTYAASEDIPVQGSGGIFFGFVALCYLKKQKASSVQFVVREPSCKCLLLQEPCWAAAHASVNALREDCRLEQAHVRRPSLRLPCSLGTSCTRHGDLPLAGLTDGPGLVVACPARNCFSLAECEALETPWRWGRSGSAGGFFPRLLSRWFPNSAQRQASRMETPQRRAGWRSLRCTQGSPFSFRGGCASALRLLHASSLRSSPALCFLAQASRCLGDVLDRPQLV